MTRGGRRAHNDATVSVGLDAALDTGQFRIGEQCVPTPQIERVLLHLRRQFNRQRGHGRTVTTPWRRVNFFTVATQIALEKTSLMPTDIRRPNFQRFHSSGKAGAEMKLFAEYPADCSA